ncbi:PAS domain-containing sensor histidine kinase [Nonlabens sp. MB-3u-79]|uniref:PAS domain-containing sensor histidine kinase n=1 Tax=Nonlabens sp. MB-3u-79 TaxID=2058134 RepID=UPI000C30EDB0|nr:PAS domain-containing sensor histidine kinase [Nonlabens sp. MB-3u-79]AUC77945.1 PAS domain-containing sensor histidine kinase [Nonlabens sp. MB-3u-79]
MDSNKIKIYERALAREKAARKEAERILEEKSKELYLKSKELEISNEKLYKLLQTKTSELKGVFGNMLDAYVVMDLKGLVLSMNEAAQKLLGYSLEGKLNLFSMVLPEERLKVLSSFQELMENGSIKDFQVKIIIASGLTRMVHINASIVYNGKNQPVAAQGIVRDITEEKAENQLLLESQNRLSTLISHLHSAVLLEDEDRNVVVTNQRFCEFFKIPLDPKEMIGINFADAAEESKHLFKNPSEFVKRINFLTKEKNQVFSDELFLKDGSILERDFIPIYEEGEYQGHLWTYRDVTLKKKYHEGIEAERQKYSSIIANMNLGLIEVDNEDRIIMENQSLEQMSGYSKKELIGRLYSDMLIVKEDQSILENENRKRLDGLSNSYEVRVKAKDGSIKHWLISGAPNYNIKGQVTGSIGIHLDITQLKSLELQKENLLDKLEKSNEELQEYAHVVSHDLKSPLLSISALMSWIKDDNQGKLSHDTLDNFKMIDATLEKMELLISDILEYSSIINNNDSPTEVDLNNVMEDIVTLLHFPDHIVFNVKKPLPKLIVDRVKIQQLFQNLISNAINYCEKERGFIEVDYQEGIDEYTFSLKDNGIGIDKEYHQKIFQIFQSLNEKEESTGIGLSIVKKIVDLYNGRIWLESSSGEGTTFFFTIKKY